MTIVRVALISDLHANDVSFEAVLDDIAAAGVDQIVCLGDVPTLGPHPREVLARLRDLGCPCIMGNHDEFMLDAELIRSYTEAPVVVDAVDWCRDRLAAEDFELIATFERTLELDLGGGATLLLFHGSPRSHMEDILATTPDEALDEMLGPHRATVMAGGHTHRQMLRRHRDLVLVNPGSLGLPFDGFTNGVPDIGEGAEYAIVEAGPRGISVDLRRVAVDRKRLRAAAEQIDMPLAPMLRAAYGA